MQLLRLGAFFLPLVLTFHGAKADPFSFDNLIKDIEGIANDAKAFADNFFSGAGAEAAVLATEIKGAADNLHVAATTWWAEQERLVASMAPGTTSAEVSASYAVALEGVRADLQKTFASRPPPAEEPASENGPGKKGKKPKAWESKLYEDVSIVLDRIEDAVVAVWGTWKAPEDQTRASFGAVKPFLRTVMILAGKFSNEHPRFFRTVILPLLMGILMPFVPKDVALTFFDIFELILKTQIPTTDGEL